jgi:hypothetical protein
MLRVRHLRPCSTPGASPPSGGGARNLTSLPMSRRSFMHTVGALSRSSQAVSQQAIGGRVRQDCA